MDVTTCAVVEDLLPLYQEGLVSENTRAFVEGHLASCPHCRRLATAAAGPAQVDTAEGGKNHADRPSPTLADPFLLRRRPRPPDRTHPTSAIRRSWDPFQATPLLP